MSRQLEKIVTRYREVLARSPMPDMELVTLALDCETLHKWLLEVADEETVAALGWEWGELDEHANPSQGNPTGPTPPSHNPAKACRDCGHLSHICACGICECGALRQQPHAADCEVRG